MGSHPVSLVTARKSIITLEPIWLVIRIIHMIIRYLAIRFRIIRIFIMIISNKSSSRKLLSIFMKIIVGILA